MVQVGADEFTALALSLRAERPSGNDLSDRRLARSLNGLIFSPSF